MNLCLLSRKYQSLIEIDSGCTFCFLKLQETDPHLAFASPRISKGIINFQESGTQSIDIIF